MKIGGSIIQDRNISIDNGTTFEATYKGYRIYVSSDHGLGEPEQDHLTRYVMDAENIETGGLDVDDYGDFHTIRDAILQTLKGALLLPSQKEELERFNNL